MDIHEHFDEENKSILYNYIDTNINNLIKYELKRHHNMFETFHYEQIDICKRKHIKKEVIDGKNYKTILNRPRSTQDFNDRLQFKIKSIHCLNDIFNRIWHILINIFIKFYRKGYRFIEFYHQTEKYIIVCKNNNNNKKDYLKFECLLSYKICISMEQFTETCRDYDYDNDEEYLEYLSNRDNGIDDIIMSERIDFFNEFMKPNMSSLFERMYNIIDIYLDELPPCIEEYNSNKRQRND